MADHNSVILSIPDNSGSCRYKSHRETHMCWPSLCMWPANNWIADKKTVWISVPRANSCHRKEGKTQEKIYCVLTTQKEGKQFVGAVNLKRARVWTSVSRAITNLHFLPTHTGGLVSKIICSNHNFCRRVWTGYLSILYTKLIMKG